MLIKKFDHIGLRMIYLGLHINRYLSRRFVYDAIMYALRMRI